MVHHHILKEESEAFQSESITTSQRLLNVNIPLKLTSPHDDFTDSTRSFLIQFPFSGIISKTCPHSRVIIELIQSYLSHGQCWSLDRCPNPMRSSSTAHNQCALKALLKPSSRVKSSEPTSPYPESPSAAESASPSSSKWSKMLASSILLLVKVSSKHTRTNFYCSKHF